MKYMGMPMGMWALFAGSFQKQLTAVFGYDADAAQAITKKAKPKYKAIIADLPEFEKADRFKMNIVNCAMIGAFIRRAILRLRVKKEALSGRHSDERKLYYKGVPKNGA